MATFVPGIMSTTALAITCAAECRMRSRSFTRGFPPSNFGTRVHPAVPPEFDARAPLSGRAYAVGQRVVMCAVGDGLSAGGPPLWDRGAFSSREEHYGSFLTGLAILPILSMVISTT